MTSLFLTPAATPGNAAWDLCLDTSGNLAVCTAPYQLAQDVACAARLFLGECWYNTTAGVPYFQQVLGKRPSIPFLAAKLQAAAMTVPGVVSAQVFITSIVGRKAVGQIQFTDTSGATQVATF